MSRTLLMPPSGIVCLDSWMVLPACAGLVSLRRSTVGDATPFAGLASGTLTSSYTAGAVSLYVLKSHSRVPIVSAASSAKAGDVVAMFNGDAGDASAASPSASAERRGSSTASTGAASREEAKTRVTG